MYFRRAHVLNRPFLTKLSQDTVKIAILIMKKIDNDNDNNMNNDNDNNNNRMYLIYNCFIIITNYFCELTRCSLLGL